MLNYLLVEFYIDIFTLSSSYGEGFSNCLVEAMACSIPCISTNVGDSEYIINNTGYIVNHSDPTAIANSWIKMLSTDNKYLGKLARQRVEQYFHTDLLMNNTSKIINSLMT